MIAALNPKRKGPERANAAEPASQPTLQGEIVDVRTGNTVAPETPVPTFIDCVDRLDRIGDALLTIWCALDRDSDDVPDQGLRSAVVNTIYDTWRDLKAVSADFQASRRAQA